MPDSDDDLERRLAAVERALDGSETGEHSVERRDDLESRIAALETRVDELDAAVQAVRGFLGGVSAVNEAVERRADAAVAAVERLEARLDGASDVGTESTPLDAGEVKTTATDGDSIEGDDETAQDDPSAPGLRERLRGLQ